MQTKTNELNRYEEFEQIAFNCARYGKTEDFILRKGEHMNLLSFFVVEIRPDGSRLRVAIKSNTVCTEL